ncbi:hypothetical protein KL864_31865 [Mycolicibacterium goodii]|uniref:hypothetical protein n=1 Tax=Mycolicibacterium goodii TaxID=134601 RepID=UPI001BDBB888|nr:hypothetical protein [Mycolicibacterium goodii]MBU8820474.1 hypothetical protein [Mycolicibacterium goodii]
MIATEPMRVLALLSSTGRAMTVAEIRATLGSHSEPVYRSLGSLRRAGAVDRVRHPGQAATHWAVVDSAALQLAMKADAPHRKGGGA